MATKLEPISRNPEYAALTAELAADEKRLAAAVRRRDDAVRRLRGAKPARSFSEMAKDLVAGAKVAGIDPAREVEAADAEMTIMAAAIREKTAKLNDMAGDLSLEISKQLEPQHTAALRRALAGIRAAQEAFADAAALRANMRDKGYTPQLAYIPDGMPPAMLAFGTGQDGRQLDQFLRYIRMHSQVAL